MQLTNTTDIPNETVRDIIKLIRPSGIANFDIMLKNSDCGISGRAYWAGSSYHHSSNPFVVLRLGKRFPLKIAPYQYGHHKGKAYWLTNRLEGLVYLAAHELRHLWQAKAKNKRGYSFGSKGRFSEVDAESFAINTLRKWRKSLDNQNKTLTP